MSGLFVARGRVDIAKLGAGKKGLQPVVVRLGNRVELVVVAAGTMQRQAEHDRTDALHHLSQDLLTRDLGVGVAADEVHGACPVKSGGREQIDRFPGVLADREQVAGELLGQKLIVRLVLDETIDHVIAVSPSMGPVGIHFVAVRLGKTDGVQPVLCLPLPEGGRGQQAIDDFFVGRRRGIRKEGVLFRNGRGQTGQIKAHPSQQGELSGTFRGRNPGRLLFRNDEGVNRVQNGGGIPHNRNLRHFRWLKGPVLPILRRNRPLGEGLGGQFRVESQQNWQSQSQPSHRDDPSVRTRGLFGWVE